jgi:hypothetical protein
MWGFMREIIVRVVNLENESLFSLLSLQYTQSGKRFQGSAMRAIDFFTEKHPIGLNSVMAMFIKARRA